jgi:Y-X(10)_GDL-associated radical SAM protein
MDQPARYVSLADTIHLTPVHVVWEITLACDLKCQHCGSRAGKSRPRELSTEECLDLVRQCARLGTREITLIGGEAYLRRDWLAIIREIRAQGMDCSLQSGGLHLTAERIRQAAKAGLQAAGISIDGFRETHDRLRGVKGSFDAALKALRLVRESGMVSSVNTQITSLVVPQLRGLMNLFIESGAKHWQVQLTVAMGRAADHPEILLQPYELLDLMPLLAELHQEGLNRGLLMQPGNNIGYFGPYEHLWRGNGDDRVHWTGCNAGLNTVGVEADGTIKGCPSLPTTPYAGGNIRDLGLKNILRNTEELSFNLTRAADTLWGFCRSCYYADVCRGGCTWTTHSLLGQPGNNPYCHHRAIELSQRGLRERVVQVESAPGTPFDHGRFALILEALDGRPAPFLNDVPEPFIENRGQMMVQIQRPVKPGVPRPPIAAMPALPEHLILCRGCKRHVKFATEICPHCGGDIEALARAYQKGLREAKKSYKQLLKLLGPTES